ncbi:LOW QUALITY PROTEIN: zinc transporter ZIP13-like [Schistocerca piceifrons]|uniref:LOW QUALITY PROTEIN: zinc transporter ZIP13-like n=1 Tax=Schistocerca piceifrons TaxID=274613 RepID=UPI001F5EEBA3|nr:LOW QUALITY PROTEIN: zinc transporter ZIP13-like [Schistocerca piceifrons]
MVSDLIPSSLLLAISSGISGFEYHPWVFSLIGSTFIGLSGIFPLLVIPIEEGANIKSEEGGSRTLKVLLSFAVGCLLGDVFLHLLPDIWSREALRLVSGYLNLLANAFDNFTHGLAVGGSFMVSLPHGALTTFAILLHEIPRLHHISHYAAAKYIAGRTSPGGSRLPSLAAFARARLSSHSNWLRQETLRLVFPGKQRPQPTAPLTSKPYINTAAAANDSSHREVQYVVFQLLVDDSPHHSRLPGCSAGKSCDFTWRE